MGARRLQETSRILRQLPKEQAFYFCTSVGDYTGESAASFDTLVSKRREKLLSQEAVE
jgi:hypothetical protein